MKQPMRTVGRSASAASMVGQTCWPPPEGASIRPAYAPLLPLLLLPLLLPLPSVATVVVGQIASTMAAAASATKTAGLMSGPAMTAFTPDSRAKTRLPTSVDTVCMPTPSGSAGSSNAERWNIIDEDTAEDEEDEAAD